MKLIIPSLLLLGILFSAAEAAQPPTWTDPATKLMWATQDNGDFLDGNAAVEYCSKLTLAGHSDWRLATIDELAGIYDPKQKVDDYYIKGGIKLSGFTWSSSASKAGEAWAFYFNLGERHSTPLTFRYGGYALCVRAT
jgi:hypothetical protein